MVPFATTGLALSLQWNGWSLSSGKHHCLQPIGLFEPGSRSSRIRRVDVQLGGPRPKSGRSQSQIMESDGALAVNQSGYR
ncbi:hypothetical protein ZWY2020_022241 [Hordeum vulgare]|nr:hypothetical protein ZWY2020_022241 [Hordeum vulgare]